MISTAIVKQLKALENGPLWLDEHFSKKLSGLSEEQVFTKPLPELHSVAELTWHLAVWIRACMDRMQGIDNDLADNSPEDWKPNDELKLIGWEQLKSDFYAVRKELIALTEKADAAFLEQEYLHSGFTFEDILFGLIQHDAYHMGQMGITIKLLK